MNAARGATIAYQQALRWKIEQDDEYAAKAVENLNKWVQTCVGVTGNTNLSLAAGLYGYEFAIAGELLRDYGGWDRADFAAFQNWLLKVFYPANDDFLKRHHDTNALHYWANWCLCNIAAKMAIGIVTDRRDIYNEGIAHLQTGDTNGRLRRAIYHDYAPDYNFAQWQESGRDQQHVQMGLAFLACAAEIAWNQDIDLYGAFDNRLYKGFEYTARYMSGEEVPHVQYMTWFGKPVYGPEISSKQREKICPAWERAYHHYHDRKGMDMPYTRKMIQKSRPEGTDNQSFMPWASLTSVGLPAR